MAYQSYTSTVSTFPSFHYISQHSALAHHNSQDVSWLPSSPLSLAIYCSRASSFFHSTMSFSSSFSCCQNVMSTNTPINTDAGEGRCWLGPPQIRDELIVDSAHSLYLAEFHAGCPSCRNPFHSPLMQGICSILDQQ